MRVEGTRGVGGGGRGTVEGRGGVTLRVEGTRGVGGGEGARHC